MPARKFFSPLLAALFFLVASTIWIPAWAGPPVPAAPGYEAGLAEARRFATEKSWALARDAYAAALPLAPGDEARRWCRLWQTDAAWRAEGPFKGWRERGAAERKFFPAIDELLAPYSKGAAKDGFWVEASTWKASRLAPIAARPMLREIAAHLSAQPPSRAAAVRLFAFLQTVMEDRFDGPLPDEDDWLASLLLRASRADMLTPDERAWCALLHAIAGGKTWRMPVSEKEALWRRALDACRDTRWETVARAREFAFRVVNGIAPGAAPDAAADVPALPGRSAALRAALASAPDEPVTRHARLLLEKLEVWWALPLLMLEAPGHVAPGEPVRFNYAAANCGEITASIYRFPMEARRENDNASLVRNGITRDPSKPFDWTKGGAHVLTRKVETAAAPPPAAAPAPVASATAPAAAGAPAWRAGSLELPPLAPGFYTLRLSDGGGAAWPRLVDFVVSDLRAFLVAPQSGEGWMHVFHHKTGEPAAGVRVAGITGKNAWESAGPTDAGGVAKLPRIEPAMLARQPTFAMAGDQPFALAGADVVPEFFQSLDRTERPVERVFADVFFDRALYRPGETVHWKLIMRQRREGRFVPCAETFHFEVARGDDTLFQSGPCAPNAAGAAHGEFRIPATVRPGAASVSLRFRDPAFRTGSLYERSFRVDNYSPPAVTLDLALADPARGARPGGVLSLRARAGYFSGGPASGATVRLSARPAHTAAIGIVEGKIRGAAEEWLKKLPDTPLTAVTGTDGCAVFDLPVPGGIPEGVVIDFAAALAGDGAPVAAEKNCSVRIAGATAFVRETRMSADLAQPGEAASCEFTIVDAAGAPRAFSGVARVMELRHDEIWLADDGHIVTDDELDAVRRRVGSSKLDRRVTPPSWKQLHSGDTASEVLSLPVNAGADGRLSVEFTPPRPGRYTVRLACDGADVPVARERYGGSEKTPELVVAGDDAAGISFAPESRVFGLGAWRAGRPLRLLVVLPAGERQAFLILAAEREVISRHIRPVGRAAVVTIDRAPAALGMVVSMLRDVGMSRNFDFKTAKVSDETIRLRVEVVPDSETARPGEAGGTRLIVRDEAGEPVRAELAVAVSDEAVGRLASGGASPRRLTPAFFDALACATAWGAVSPAPNPNAGPRLPPDFRPGALLNPSRPVMSTREIIGMDVEEAMAMAGYTEIGETFGAARSGAAHSGGGIQLRQHFASTAFWAPEVLTGADGAARVSFKYPDNLTEWRVTAYAVGADGNTFGVGEALTRATLPFQARLQTPRFLVAGDRAEISALLINRTGRGLRLDGPDGEDGVRFQPEGPVTLAPAATAPAVPPRAAPAGAAAPRFLPPGAEIRVPRVLTATRAGDAALSLFATAYAGNGRGRETDAMRAALPVREDGFLQRLAASAVLAPGAPSATLALALPAAPDPGRDAAVLQLTASPAAAMLDALPWLIAHPHGCVEQTMNRFLPAVVVKHTLAGLGLDPAAVEKRMLAPAPFAAAAARPRPAAGFAALDEVVSAGLARLVQARHEDGGFSWWPDGRPDAWMTAYVAWGLHLAGGAGADVPATLRDPVNKNLVETAADFADPKKPAPGDTGAWVLAAAAQAAPSAAEKLRPAFVRAYENRDAFSPAGRACLLLAARALGTPGQRAVLLRNIENGAQKTPAAAPGVAPFDTVWWGSASGWSRAMDGAVESTALTLLALLENDPAHPLVDPAADWLVLNRRGARWHGTRDTAFAILALARRIALQKQIATAAGDDTGVELVLNDEPLRLVRITPEDFLTGSKNIPLPLDRLRPGENHFTLRRRSGGMPVYAAIMVSAWTRGAGVKPAAHQIGAAREFVRWKTTPTLIGGLLLDAAPLAPDGFVASGKTAARAGEQITAVITLDAPNALEYVMVGVPRPAGCEPLNPLSGRDARLVRTGDSGGGGSGEAGGNGGSAEDDEDDENDGLLIYREEHDDRSVFFLDRLDAGRWQIRFPMRAVTRGDYRALPAEVSAMYAPDIRAHTDARRVRIE
jgi:uncharacterized protein YfaS (alpha-2-macroglobulin family)